VTKHITTKTPTTTTTTTDNRFTAITQVNLCQPAPSAENFWEDFVGAKVTACMLLTKTH